MHINPFIESKMAFKNECKDGKPTIVLIYMGFFSRETPCSATGAATGAKWGCAPAKTIFWGDVQLFGCAKMTCARSLVVSWAGVCELWPGLRGGCGGLN